MFDIDPDKVGLRGCKHLESDGSIRNWGHVNLRGIYLRHESARDPMADAEQCLSRICLSLTQSFLEVPWLY